MCQTATCQVISLLLDDPPHHRVVEEGGHGPFTAYTPGIITSQGDQVQCREPHYKRVCFHPPYVKYAPNGPPRHLLNPYLLLPSLLMQSNSGLFFHERCYHELHSLIGNSSSIHVNAVTSGPVITALQP